MSKIYDSASTKEEELQGLTNLARCFKSGSYLYDFFTPALLNWLAEQIKNDFVPDLYGRMEASLIEQDNQHKEDLRTIQAREEDIKTLENEQRVLNAEYARSERELKYTKEQAERQAKELDEFAAAYSQSLSEKSELNSEIERLNAEIVKLKAKIYDLQNS